MNIKELQDFLKKNIFEKKSQILLTKSTFYTNIYTYLKSPQEVYKKTFTKRSQKF